MGKKIMVVDDEPDILSSVGQMLELNGYEVIKASDGKDCLDKLYSLSINPDLIILDIMMPDVSGWDVVAKLKENSKWKSIPVVFLTAKGDAMSVGMGGLTAMDYIVKPFDVKNLILRIKKILKDT
jgi:two-component system alkaline phosphatase synthesis response regulator PhoP